MATLLVQVVAFAVRPATIYRGIEAGVPTAWLGVLSASFALTPLLLAVPAGRVIDRVGERVVGVTGAGCLVVATGVLVLGGDAVVGLFAGTVLLGLGHLFSIIAQQTWVANADLGGSLDTAFGRYTFAASFGQSLGPGLLAVVGGTAVRPDTTPVLVSGLVLSATLLVVVPWLRPTGPRGPGRPDGADTAPVTTWGLLRRPGVGQALVTSSVILAAVDVTLAYLPALGVERGIGAATVGTLLALRGVASMASRLGLGRLVERFGRKAVMVGFSCAAAVGLVLTAVPAPLAVLAVGVVVAGVGLGVGQPLTMSWLAETAPPGARGRSMSLRLVGNRAGQVVIPSLAGAVAAGTGAAGVLLMTAAAVGLVGVGATRLPLGGRSAGSADA